MTFNTLPKSKQNELISGWKSRNKDLKKSGISPDSFETYLEWIYGKGKKVKSTKIKHVEPIIRKDSNRKNASLSSWVTGAVSTKKTPVYTGDNVIGITIVHKSCLQPVFSKQEAVDVANMRR